MDNLGGIRAIYHFSALHSLLFPDKSFMRKAFTIAAGAAAVEKAEAQKGLSRTEQGLGG